MAKMIPIALDWSRPEDGISIVNDDENYGQSIQVLRYRTPRELAVRHTVASLDAPLAISLINATSPEGLVQFTNRFGLLERMSTPRQYPLSSVEDIRDELLALLTLYSPDDPLQLLDWTNSLMADASLDLCFSLTEGGSRRLIYRAGSLKALLLYECAVAIDVGAVLARCEHCDRAFLTGPLTRNRSHAKFCSDRCRVAQHRARQARGFNAEEVK